jgi:hypothetical protein
MSDRTQSSVRTGSRSGDADAAVGAAPAGAVPATSTQSIPGASTPRTQTGSPGAAAPAGSSVSSSGSTGAASVAPIPQSGTGTGQAVAGSGATETAVDGTGKGRSRGRGPAKAGGRGPRRARLQLRHVDIWSAFKISLVLSIALYFIWMVAVGLLYGVLSGLGVFDTINELFGQLGTASGAGTANDVVTWRVVLGGAAVVGAINIVLMTALCTVGTFIYNLCSDLVGGLELTLSERD